MFMQFNGRNRDMETVFPTFGNKCKGVHVIKQVHCEKKKNVKHTILYVVC